MLLLIINLSFLLKSPFGLTLFTKNLSILSGETSAGKSTLINKILGKEIFSPELFESASTICKIRNSKCKIIISKLNSGQEDKKVFDGQEVDSETVHKILSELLESEKSKKIAFVDVGFPIPFLKVTFYYLLKHSTV